MSLLVNSWSMSLMTLCTCFIMYVSFWLFRAPNNMAKRLSLSVLCLMIGVLSDAYTTSARLQFWANVEVVFFLLVLLYFKSFTLANRGILASENPTASTLLFNLFSLPIHLTLLMCAKKYQELQELDGTIVIPAVTVYDPSPLE
ncbi:hypothetical protein CAEBREN_08367 [Caenorhabditis brenneri]|uniref:Uncharacterized protein n=1 Tax=Caenorhabditis brenneri TaxID=135651 RepID=G0MG77_CAEBE|nr:hypothetical protein CAEBREN_08367 [Caenorhabditis brenneri]